MNNPDNKLLTIDDLIEKVSVYDNNSDDLKSIREAYEYAAKKHFGQKRISGEDYIQHPLHVALILTEISSDRATICAALLHDTIEDSSGTREEISSLFGNDVGLLVDGVTKINKLHFASTTEQIAANQRKILVGLSEDPRVIIIKLADRLHNMRTIEVMSVEKQKRKSKENLEILTPVAHRLGIYKIKSELEDLSLRYLKPNVYFDILEKLNNKRAELDESVGKMISEVSDLLNDHSIKHEIKGRSKSVYSIYKKLAKGKSFNDIYDILALRVFVDTTQECYLALGLIHSKYKPVPKRFKDYIAMPKTNMYQSLHTTVFGVDGKLFEIQIRTYEMDKIAEYGIASHWSYKENSNGREALKDEMEQKLQIFRSIIELNESAGTPLEFINNVKHDVLINNSIYVYTPKGDVIELPKGSTPVDFAYKVHSDVGNYMVSAIVNDNIVSLDYKLKTGDIIKVNTNKSSKGPNKEWLKFIATSQARNKIKSFYSKLEKDDNRQKGLEEIENEIKRRGLTVSEVLSNKNIDTILNYLNIKDVEELYIGIGSSKYTVGNVLRIILGKEENKPKILEKNKNNKVTDNKNDILVAGITDIKVNLSSCCKPIPKDNIIGYITRGSGITVHRANCKNIIDIDERVVPVKWNPDSEKKKYFTDIIIYTNSSDKLLEIITKASTSGIVIDSVNTINRSDMKVYNMTILVEDKDVLEKFMNDLRNFDFVLKVERRII